MNPGPVLRWLLRAPTALYRARVGWLLGHRFVVSGFGPGVQWYRNVLAGGAVEVQVGRVRFAPAARVLSSDEAAIVLEGYEVRHRLAAWLLRPLLSRLAGIRYDGSATGRRELVRRLPVVAFRPGGLEQARQALGARHA